MSLTSKSTIFRGFLSSPAFPYCLLLAIVVAVFGNALGHEFVWDDHIYLLNKPVYQAFDLRRIFFSLANDLEYLPVRDLSYAIDYAIWGRNPFGFHLTNLILYTLTVVLVYQLIRRLCSLLPASADTATSTPRSTSLIGAALFAVHPIHAEVVNFITGRNALLSGLFSVLACLAFCAFLAGTKQRWLFYAGSLGCFILALFSKATCISLPLVFILLIILGHQEQKRLLLTAVIPFLALAASSFALFRSIAMKSFLMPAEKTCFTLACIAQKAAVASQIPLFYLGKLLVPLRLMPEYVVQFSDRLTSPEVLLALAGLLGIIFAALFLRRRQPLILLGVGWYLLTMVPVLHIFPTYPIVADRYAYLPSFGFALCLATVGASWAGSHNRQRAVNLVAGILVIVLALLTLQQNRIWHSGETLWKYTMQLSPRSVKAYTNLGRIYFSAGRYAEAFALFDQARQLEPSDPHYDFFEGMLFFVRSDFRQALPHFERALFRADGFLEALFHAGMAHDALGNRDQAVAYFTKTVQSKQDDLGGFRAQARVYLLRLQGQ